MEPRKPVEPDEQVEPAPGIPMADTIEGKDDEENPHERRKESQP